MDEVVKKVEPLLVGMPRGEDLLRLVAVAAEDETVLEVVEKNRQRMAKGKTKAAVGEEVIDWGNALGSEADEAFLAKLFETHFVLQFGSDVRIAHWTIDPALKQERLLLVSRTGFNTYHANRSLTVKDAEGKSKTVPVASVFINRRNNGAKRLHGVVLVPDAPEVVEGHLNLWRGFSVDPAPGDWSLMRQHIHEVLAGGNAEYADYITKWCAWTLQNPGAQAEVALVFRGGKGSGKGVFGRTLSKLFGAHGMQISNSRQLVGNFNKHLMYCCLLFADEAFWAGDRQGEGELKRLITEETLFIEPKGLDAFTVRNRLHVIMASNEDWVVPASADERRFAIFDVSGHRMKDDPYFARLYAQLEAGGLGAMLHDLRALDLGGWHPRSNVPQTEALQEQKLQSVSGIDNIVYAMALDGVVPCAAVGKPNTVITDGEDVGQGFWAYCKRDPALKYQNSVKLAPKLKAWGFIKYRGSGNARGYTAPPLGELRAALDRKFGATEWSEQKNW